MMRAIEQIQERADRAGDHVAKLCTKEDRWRMSVPPRSTDSDVLLVQVTDHDVPAMAHALKAVLEIHETATAAGTGRRYCTECTGTYDPDYTYFPCPTVQAIHEHLGDQE